MTISDEKLALIALDEVAEGISIADMTKPDQPLIFVNKGFERLTGYTAKDVVGKNCRFLQRKHVDQRGLQKLRRSLEAGKHCRVDLINYKKNGEKFWNELSLSPIKDDNGKVVYYIGIQKDISARVEYEQLLDRKSKTDALTGVYNRRALEGYWRRFSRVKNRDELSIALVLIDIDDFKAINDLFGHSAGDKALKFLADFLKQVHRDKDCVTRLGGDEFAVLLVDEKPIDVQAYYERLMRNFDDALSKANLPTKFSISVGVEEHAFNEGKNNSLDAVMKRADKAMYQDKRSKKVD